MEREFLVHDYSTGHLAGDPCQQPRAGPALSPEAYFDYLSATAETVREEFEVSVLDVVAALNSEDLRTAQDLCRATGIQTPCDPWPLRSAGREARDGSGVAKQSHVRVRD